MKEHYIDILDRQSKSTPSRVILRGKKDDQAWYDVTWAELWNTIESVGKNLLRYGVKRADNIIIFSSNTTEWIASDLGALSIGAVTVPLYPTSSSSHVKYIIKETGTRIAFVGAKAQYDTLIELYAKGEIDLDHIIVFDENVALVGEKSEYFSKWIAQDTTDMDKQYATRRSEASLDDMATIIYTSGTTGEPKGVMIGQDNIHQMMRIHDERLDLNETDSSLSFLPLCHVFERGWSWYCLYKNCQVNILTDTKKIGETLPQVAPTAFCCVPRLYEKIYQKVNTTVLSGPKIKVWIFNWAMGVGRAYSECRRKSETPSRWLKIKNKIADRLVFSSVRKATGGRLRIMPTAGSHVPYFIVDFFHAMGIPIMVGYGLTETCATVSACPTVGFEPGSIGRPFPEIEVKIGAENEILVRSKTIMRGYYKKPEATAEAIDAQGWFHTGDAGMLDDKGNLFITERIKDLMKTSQGKYIAPQMIESRLSTDVFIEQVVVVGDQKPYVTALVVPNFEVLKEYALSKGLTFKSLEELVNMPKIKQMYQDKINELQKEFAGFEMIKKFTLLAKEFSMEAGELTPTMKIRRKIIIERLAPQIAQMYS